VTLPSKYPSSEERQDKGKMLLVFIMAGFVGLIFLPVYFGIKGMFGPNASFYLPVITTVVTGVLALLVRMVIRYFLRRYLQ
jgi:hypothetical protein